MVVSFGTTYQETREKNIDQMVALVREQYPHYLVEEAYSSSTVRKVLRERDGIAKDDVRQAFCRMRDAGVRRVIVFPTHIIDVIENRRMKQEVTDCAPWFEDVRIADALLKTPEDYQRTAEALWESVAAEAGSSPVIFMGHGSEHAADESYERLECVLAQVTENDVYVATVEGSVTIDDVIGRMKVSRHKSGRVLVAPFMLVAGDHADQQCNCGDRDGNDGADGNDLTVDILQDRRETIPNGVCENRLNGQHGGRGHTNCGPVGILDDVFALGNMFNHVLLPPFLVMERQKTPF